MIVEGAPTSMPCTNVQLGGGPEADAAAESAQTTMKWVMICSEVVGCECVRKNVCIQKLTTLLRLV